MLARIVSIILISAVMVLGFLIFPSPKNLKPQEFYRVTIKDNKGEIITQRSKVDIYVVTPDCVMYMIKTNSGQDVFILEKIEPGQKFLVEKFYEVEL